MLIYFGVTTDDVIVYAAPGGCGCVGKYSVAILQSGTIELLKVFQISSWRRDILFE